VRTKRLALTPTAAIAFDFWTKLEWFVRDAKLLCARTKMHGARARNCGILRAFMRRQRFMTKMPARLNGIDRIDLNILAALFSRARLSKVQMSSEVGVSASRCHERMRHLEQAGIIRGYHADIDLTRLTSCMQFLVEIKIPSTHSKQFEKVVLQTAEIISCQSVLGHTDYIIVVVAESIEKYQAVIAELRASTDGEFDFVTFPVSKTIKSSGQGDLRRTVVALTRENSASS
jgi:Lrp/AsnC family transcriptional regulator, regulator of ectoine-degradation genes